MRASSYPLLEVSVAAGLVMERTPILGSQEIALGDAGGRVLAADVTAPADLPSWPVSAVDGYAVTSGAGNQRTLIPGESAAGNPFDGTLAPGEAARILTGGIVPAGAVAVVMLEDVTLEGNLVLLPQEVVAGSNIHQPGDDIRGGETVARAGTALGPAEIGLIGALGLARIAVRRRPRVALLSTGDELVEVGEPTPRGRIPDSNRWALGAALTEAGAEVRMLGIAPDRPGPLRDLVEDALRSADVLVTSGGVSVGTHDLVKPLLAAMGEVHVGRVKLRPGKPFTFATLPGGRIAFGLPGFPVSSLVTFEVFVRPALRRMQGHAALQRPVLPVTLGYDARAAGDRTEYQRVSLRSDARGLVAYSTGSQSSSRLMSLVGADALVAIPPGEAGHAAGSRLDAMILALPS